MGLFIGLILLREALRLPEGGWNVSVPVWLVFIPLGMALLVRPVRADDAPPHTFSPPVHGRWTAINSPATQVPSHPDFVISPNASLSRAVPSPWFGHFRFQTPSRQLIGVRPLTCANAYRYGRTPTPTGG